LTEWKYRSLEWIHRIREENYRNTRKKSLKEVVSESVKEAKRLIG